MEAFGKLFLVGLMPLPGDDQIHFENAADWLKDNGHPVEAEVVRNYKLFRDMFNEQFHIIGEFAACIGDESYHLQPGVNDVGQWAATLTIHSASRPLGTIIKGPYSLGMSGELEDAEGESSAGVADEQGADASGVSDARDDRGHGIAAVIATGT